MSVSAVAVATALGCGGSGESSTAFCEELVSAEADIAALGAGDAADFDQVVERLQGVDPPGQISNEFEAVVAAYDGLSESGSLTDPASQVDLVAVQDDLAAVSEFVAEECSSG